MDEFQAGTFTFRERLYHWFFVILLLVSYSSVQGDPPTFTSSPQNVTVIEEQNRNLTLNCTVNGSPTPDVKWTKDGIDISENQGISVSNFSGVTSSLTIINIVRGDEGQYRCVANNSVNTTTSSPGKLTVNFRADVKISGREPKFVEISKPIQLTCQYNASPPASGVQWEKSGSVITQNGRVNIMHLTASQSQLLISSSTIQDEGSYTCVITNSVGNSSFTTSVIIQVVPDPPKNVSLVTKGSRTIEISWMAGFNGSSAIQNYTVEIGEDKENFTDAGCQGTLLNGTCVVSNSTNASLTGLFPFTKYFIRVFATNAIGRSNSSSVVIVTTDEEEPTAAPANVVGQSLSSKSILVTWNEVPPADQNGIITSYNVTYQSLTENHSNSTTVNYTVRQVTLSDLKEFVNYSITVFASTKIGDGPASDPVYVKTDEDEPTAAPVNVRGHKTSSTSILVKWDDVPDFDQNGIITSYNITYRSKTENHNGFAEAGSNDRQKEVTDLREYVEYDITVRASTSKGDGPDSSPITVRTDQDEPSSSPQGVQASAKNSTSVSVSWAAVGNEQRNGIIKGYKVIYQALPHGRNVTRFVNISDEDQGKEQDITLGDLVKFTNYSIRVLAFTVVGEGPPSEVKIVQTQQDKPTAAPANVVGQSLNSKSISVTWNEVPPADQNGIITSYNITYHSLTENHSNSTTVDYPDRQVTLLDLKEFVNYSITVFASTKIGDGPASDPVYVKTDEDKPTDAPANVVGQSLNSKSISVTWNEVPPADQNGIITSYNITFHSLTENHSNSITVDYPDRQVTLSDLKEFVNYSITVFASTKIGDGPASDPVYVKTDEDRPSAAPKNLRSINTTSTSIFVMWDKVSPDERNGIIISYNVSYRTIPEAGSAGPFFSKLVMAPTRHVNLTDLTKDMHYKISVLASTRKGDGIYSDPKTLRTNEDRPGAPPQNVTGYNTSSTSINVTWNEVPKDKQHGDIILYTVMYNKTTNVINKSEVTPISGKFFELKGLDKYAIYDIKVLAATNIGDGPASDPIKVQTDEDRPIGFPQNLQGFVISSTSIKVKWDEVPRDQQHGVITQYTVMYKTSRERSYELKVDRLKFAVLPGLAKYTYYDIKIKAATSKGFGPESPPIRKQTDQDKPEKPPQSVTVTTLDSSRIEVTWKPVPKDFQHGIITEYVILYNYSGEGKISEHKVLGNVSEVVVGGLKQSTEYTIRVLAATVKGKGPASSPKSATTEDPPKPSEPEEGDVGKTEVNIPFVPKQELSDGAPVTKYQVIVMELTDGQDEGKSSDPKYAKVTRKYEDRVAGEPYVTAEFANNNEKRTSFPVGDGKYYSTEGVTDAKRKRRKVVEKFLNGKLDDGAKYVAFQRSFDKEGDYESEGFVDFETNKDHTVTIVVVVVLIVIITACIAVGIFVYRRRQSSPRNGEEEMALRPQKRGRTLSQKILGRGSGAFDNPAHNPGEAVPVEEFEEHVRRLHANGDLLFSQEYGALKPQAEFTWNATLAQENRHKNRYNNIVAYDHSRVKLSPIQGVPGSDYINANFLDGYQKKSAYIASQGPLPETEDDFWRMIWEQDSKIIVMVTNLEERGRIKCHQYWPSEGGKAYGDIQVTLMQIVELSDFTIRTFTLKKANSRSERTLHQYHYTVWPDHGVPSCPTSLLTFVKKASGANPADAGPMVVHCSAGVGRTGTFIVVDAMLQSIAAEKTVDVFGYVMTLRRDRNIMVQVEEQYVFIHEVLLEAIHSGYTEIRANDLRSHMKLLMQVSPLTGQTEMDEEFIRLGRGNTPQTKFQAANMGYNKTKNRYANVLAFDDTRVKLSMITGIEGSDYINANFIDGYMTRRAFIATQAPIPDTIPDFWRMIWEQESSTIVMLSKETESGKVKVHRYWPAKQPANIGTLVVEMTNEMVYEDYTMREIKLTNTKESASRVVRQYHYTGWPDVGSPESGTGLIDLIGQVQRWQQNSGNTTITVHCSAGVGRTGVFCALSILIERLKSEGVVDVFQTVKQLRAQRPAMVQTKDQYEFIYSALSEYLDSFDAYSNFE